MAFLGRIVELFVFFDLEREREVDLLTEDLLLANMADTGRVSIICVRTWYVSNFSRLS